MNTPAPRPEADDPSMEDILASIRRILDEETPAVSTDPVAVPEAEAPAPGAAGAGGPPVLELDHSMLLPEPELATGGPIPAPPVRAEPIPSPPPQPAAPLAVPSPPVSGLVAPEAAAAAAGSVGALLKTLASERGTAVTRGGLTIEDMVRDEIRPLLKEWLDLHLAPMVERLVRAEIERVISRT